MSIDQFKKTGTGILRLFGIAAIALAIGVGLVACGPSAEAKTVAGSYQLDHLKYVDGSVLTAQTMRDGDAMSPESFSFSLTDTDNFSFRDSRTDISIDGSYSISDDTITLQSDSLAEPIVGRIVTDSGSGITTVTFEYAKTPISTATTYVFTK